MEHVIPVKTTETAGECTFFQVNSPDQERTRPFDFSVSFVLEFAGFLHLRCIFIK